MRQYFVLREAGCLLNWYRGHITVHFSDSRDGGFWPGLKHPDMGTTQQFATDWHTCGAQSNLQRRALRSQRQRNWVLAGRSS